MRASVIAAVTCIASAVQPSVAQSRAPEIESIRQADLRADLFFLASDAMQGRATNTAENGLAAEFIKSRFERMGLEPAAPDGSYFHRYNLATATLGPENRLVVSQPRFNRELTQRPGQDYYPLRFSASGSARGTLVYAGFGIASPAHDHDDYQGEPVAGKIVLVLAHEPGERDPASPFDGLVTSEVSRNVRKALYAQERGAAAVVFVSDVHNHPGPSNFDAAARSYWPEQTRRARYMLASWMEQVRIPVLQISAALARSLLEGTGHTLDELAQSAERAGGIRTLPLEGPEVEIVASVDRHIVPDRNVLAKLPGSDPDVSDEWVIISAHYDHVGADGGRIFNGADDDGSGTVSLIEIAEAYATAAKNGVRPRRSILFAAWNSEERGLLGAWAYADDPLFPLEQTVAVLNMDMVGRNEEIPEGGGRRFRGLDVQTAESNANAVNIMGYTFSSDLRQTIEASNPDIGLELKMRYDNNPSNLLRRSDQWPFLYNGVPAVFFHTGLHPDYHTEFDVPEKINYAKMEKIARLVFQTSWTLARQEGRPAFRKRPVPISDDVL